ncbi:hypothetical protein NQ315_016222 [Exocentrus adspersus]|uniref:Uncharacterized protein n=1 Tax=Exocentrus adspersus TaxID=1586481 RepID=A0AAV8VIZ2_9CUCU|nr:hypothetical protein NQ315_016222 [Exocentrus adspersus]
MLGRQPRTRWRLLEEKTRTDKVQERQSPASIRDRQNIRMKRYHGGVQIRSFSPGEVVFIKDHRNVNHPSWTRAEVVKRIGRTTYLCQLPEGQIWKRHTNQIKKSDISHKTQLSTVPTPSSNNSLSRDRVDSFGTGPMPNNNNLRFRDQAGDYFINMHSITGNQPPRQSVCSDNLSTNRNSDETAMAVDNKCQNVNEKADVSPNKSPDEATYKGATDKGINVSPVTNKCSLVQKMETIIKSRFRFTEEFDLHLVREVYGQNPYEDQNRWSIIQVNMLQITGRCISIRTLKERIQNLMKKYLTKTRHNEGKSGIEEPVCELDDLIQQIIDLIKEFENKKKKHYNVVNESGNSCLENYSINNSEVSHTVEIETDSARNMTPVGVTLENLVEGQLLEKEKITKTPKKRSLGQENILSPGSRNRAYNNVKQVTLQYLNKKYEKQYEIRARELVLEERKQNLLERKFELEAEERRKNMEIEEKRLVLEEKRLSIQLEVFQNQQSLIKAVLQKNVH